ncbi:CoA-binding protein, partial [Rhizobiaceae sp. 2RAB30]
NAAKGAIVASLPENLPEEYCADLIARGIVPLYGINEAMDAAEAAAAIGEAWASGAAPAVVETAGSGNGLAKRTPDEAEA